jgi:endonuclease YncB( thermonuclease family)
VRLIGIDAPDIGRGLATSAPFAMEARTRLTDLLLHRWVRLEEDVQRLDVYNRHLAYVTTGDGEAQEMRRGIWGQAPGIPPTGYTPPAKVALPKAKKAAPKAPPKPSKK